MTDKQVLFHIGFKFILFFSFLYFAINSVETYGWSFMPILFAVFATKDFVQGSRIIKVYYRMKSNKKQ